MGKRLLVDGRNRQRRETVPWGDEGIVCVCLCERVGERSDGLVWHYLSCVAEVCQDEEAGSQQHWGWHSIPSSGASDQGSPASTELRSAGLETHNHQVQIHVCQEDTGFGE